MMMLMQPAKQRSMYVCMRRPAIRLRTATQMDGEMRRMPFAAGDLTSTASCKWNEENRGTR